MSRSMFAGFFPCSSLIVPSSRLVPMSRVYLSPLKDQVAFMGIGWPICTQDSTFQSPSSFLRSLFSSFSLSPGAAVVPAGPASKAKPTASDRCRFIEHLGRDQGPSWEADGDRLRSLYAERKDHGDSARRLPLQSPQGCLGFLRQPGFRGARG